MAIPMKQFIDRFKAMEKVANETLAAEPGALVGVDSLPGSEHDAKVPAEAKKPDKEVTQGQPAGATTTEGAVNGGDAKPLNEGKLEMDQPLLNPEQKPLVTDDALSAKTASDKLTALVGDLLADLKSAKAPEKQAADKAPEKQAAAKAPEKAGQPKEKKAERQKIELDDATLNKLAAAQASYMLGREAASNVLKQAAAKNPQTNAAAARELIKGACVKAAQEDGLDPATAEIAAENAMNAAGMGDAGAAEAAGAEGAGAAEAAGIPEDVTEEELATAIVDLVDSGELDPNTAEALVEEMVGNDAGGEAAPTEDEAAEIIAQGLENGEITPEQAQAIAEAIEADGAGEAAASDAEAAGAADAAAAAQEASDEAAGAADAAAAIQDVQDEAQGAADAEEAMKSAAAQIRANTISKVASEVVANRQQKQASAQPAAGSRVMSKVAGILKAKADQAKAEKAASAQGNDAKYIEGFKKKAEEMGVNPSALAKYILDRQAK